MVFKSNKDLTAIGEKSHGVPRAISHNITASEGTAAQKMTIQGREQGEAERKSSCGMEFRMKLGGYIRIQCRPQAPSSTPT